MQAHHLPMPPVLRPDEPQIQDHRPVADRKLDLFTLLMRFQGNRELQSLLEREALQQKAQGAC